MSENRANIEPPEPAPIENDYNENFVAILLVLKSLIVIAMVVLPFLYCAGKIGPSPSEPNGIRVNQTTIIIHIKNVTNEKRISKTATIVVRQPSSPQIKLQKVLQELLELLIMKKTQCTPEDFHDEAKHQIPKRPALVARSNTTSSESRGVIVGYIATGILLASLGAALIELYKAKLSQSTKSSKTTQLSRKCSLADLTVLKHHRKELMQRDSILEVPGEDASSTYDLGKFRPRPPPLRRRSSFPVGTNGILQTSGSSFDADSARRLSIVDSRRGSFLESRRQSLIINDSRRGSYIDAGGNRRDSCLDMKRMSLTVPIDDLMERKHYSRLVHRH